MAGIAKRGFIPRQIFKVTGVRNGLSNQIPLGQPRGVATRLRPVGPTILLAFYQRRVVTNHNLFRTDHAGWEKIEQLQFL